MSIKPSHGADEDKAMTEPGSGPATPYTSSNPGTPRTEESGRAHHSNPATPRMDEVRATPPPPQPTSSLTLVQPMTPVRPHNQAQSKYTQLLSVIEDMEKDIRPTYAGNRGSTERLKRGIVHARILVRECLIECERSARM